MSNNYLVNFEFKTFMQKQNYGLGIQDLQEEKDKLLIETGEMLRCSIFTAEILLKKHGNKRLTPRVILEYIFKSS